jgi:hypothetical protein
MRSRDGRDVHAAGAFPHVEVSHQGTFTFYVTSIDVLYSLRKMGFEFVRIIGESSDSSAGAEAFGYDTGLWTAARVAQLIEQECGIAYHPGHVWRLLRQLGWSCQRPTGRALERDEQAIAQWKRKRWPEI